MNIHQQDPKRVYDIIVANLKLVVERRDRQILSNSEYDLQRALIIDDKVVANGGISCRKWLIAVREGQLEQEQCLVSEVAKVEDQLREFVGKHRIEL